MLVVARALARQMLTLLLIKSSLQIFMSSLLRMVRAKTGTKCAAIPSSQNGVLQCQSLSEMSDTYLMQLTARAGNINLITEHIWANCAQQVLSS